MTVLAWINEQTNVCDNITTDARPASEIKIAGYTIMDLNEIGGGGVGDIWNGTKLEKPPEPVIEQPVTKGIQTL